MIGSRSCAWGLVRGVLAHRHRHRGQLLGGGAELVHVPAGRHGVVAHQGVAPQGVVDGGPRGEPAPAPTAGAEAPTHLRELDAAVGDEHHLGRPGLHRVGGVLHEHLERRPARVGLVEVGGVEPQVLGHPGGVHGEEAGGGEPVDVGEGQPGVGQGPVGGLAVDGVLGELGEIGVVRRRHPGDHGPPAPWRRHGAPPVYGGRCAAGRGGAEARDGELRSHVLPRHLDGHAHGDLLGFHVDQVRHHAAPLAAPSSSTATTT